MLKQLVYPILAVARFVAVNLTVVSIIALKFATEDLAMNALCYRKMLKTAPVVKLCNFFFFSFFCAHFRYLHKFIFRFQINFKTKKGKLFGSSSFV